MRVSAFFIRWVAVALAVWMLVWVAWWNGQRLLDPDTPTYLRGA